uniref:Uncharacterized protein n=1 Tax=Solanum lycopersicum TaxID=4081 RepID=A0A494G8H8_SOLLC
MNTRLDSVRHGIPSLQFDNIHKVGLRQALQDLGMVCHHRTWTANTVGKYLARHAIMDLVQNTQSNDVRRSRPSSPLNNIDRIE